MAYPIVEYARGSPKEQNLYYGLNVSPNLSLEPIDQMDGFLVARYLQESEDRKFYPYIAGIYGALNARSPKEVLQVAKKKTNQDREKKILLRNVMENLGIRGTVLTTNDLWEDEEYWTTVRCLVEDGILEKLPENLRLRGVRMKDFPKDVLGKMEKIVGRKFDEFYSGSIYVPAEIAEAVWLKNRYGVGWKLGPPSEDLYDRFIEQQGIGIVRISQPKALEGDNIVDVLPYIGKATQPKRILFADTELRGKCLFGNPSFERAMTLSDIYEAICGLSSQEPVERIYRLISLGKSDVV